MVQGSEQAKNANHTFRGYNQSLPKTFTCTSAPVTAPWVRLDENFYYSIPSSNRPTPLYNVSNTLLSSTYDSFSVMNNAVSQSDYRPRTSLQLHGMPGIYYSANLPESLVPISNPQVRAPHPQLTSCVFHKNYLFLPPPEFIKFDGHPLDFTISKTNSERNVTPKVRE